MPSNDTSCPSSAAELRFHESHTVHIAPDVYERSISPDEQDQTDALWSLLRRKASEYAATPQMHTDRRDTGLRHYDHGTTESVFQMLTLVFGSGSALLAYLKAIHPLLVEWIKGRAHRGVTVERGDVKISIRGSDDVDKAIRAIRELEGLAGEDSAEDNEE